MALPPSFIPDPEHQVDGSMANAGSGSVPLSATQGVIPRPGANPPVQAQISSPQSAPPSFKPDVPPPPPRLAPQDVPAFPGEAADLEQQQREQQTGQGLKGAGLAYGAAGGEMLGGALATAAGIFRATRAAAAAADTTVYGVAGSTGGKFSAQRLGNILAEDADKVTQAAQNGTKIPPFQEWGRIAETLSDNSKTAGALKTLWSDPKYRLVRWATLAALTGGGGGAGMAKYMMHRAMYDAVVP